MRYLKVIMGLRGVGFLISLAFTQMSHAFESCDQLNTLAQNNPSFIPRLSAKISVKSATLLSAPSKICAKQLLVIGSEAVVYIPYNNYYYVMGVNENTGEDFSGWIVQEHLSITGNLGPN